MDEILFLKWALPQLRFRYEGFRRVRRQVLRRVTRRLQQLELPELGDYKKYLETYPAEWDLFDECCRITISRFYRDRLFWQNLAGQYLPAMVRQSLERRASHFRIWSAGCGSGEEPYTVSICWRLHEVLDSTPVEFEILGTEVDEALLTRASRAIYPASSLRDLPEDWILRAFDQRDDGWKLRKSFRQDVRFERSDIRYEFPQGRFDLILCRNLAFTYFEPELQIEVLSRLTSVAHPDSRLAIGNREVLPAEAKDWVPAEEQPGLWRLVAG